MSIRWDSESDWKDNQDSSGTTGRNGELKQGYSRDRPPLSQDLVGYWPLHDANAQDYSGNDNHGNLNGGITTGVSGKGGLQATSFKNQNGFLKKTGINDFPSGSEERTLSAWVRVSSDEKQGIAGFGCDSDNQAFALLVSGNGKFTGQLWGGSYDMETGIVPSQNRGWHHHALKFNGSDLIYYFDGEEIKRENRSPNTCSPADLYIGAEMRDDRNLFRGQIQNVRLYNRSLPASEIQTLYEWGNGDYARPPNDGTSYYKLDGDATDSWNNKDGSTNGGLVYSSDSIRGQSSDFDGSDDYIDLGTNLGEASDLTVSAWIKLDSIPGSNYTEICTKRRVTAFSVNSNNGELHGNLGDGSSWGNGVNGSPLPVGEWIHVTAVYDSGNEIILYQNGVEDTRGAESLSIGSNSKSRGIGAKYKSQWANFIDGKIDDLRIYDRKLKPREIFELYRHGTRGRDMRKFLVTH